MGITQEAREKENVCADQNSPEVLEMISRLKIKEKKRKKKKVGDDDDDDDVSRDQSGPPRVIPAMRETKDEMGR